MTLQELMHELRARGARVEWAGDELKVTAAKGALTSELREALRERKAEIVSLLRGESGSTSISATLRPQERYEPFPFTDLQTAFYMADNPYLEYHVRPHYYCESDADGLDVERYLAALNKAIRRHCGEVVLAVDDRHQCAMRDIAEVRCPVNDMRDLDEGEARRRLAEMRERLSRQQLPLDCWPWFDLQISLWREEGRGRTRIHFNHNNFYTDGYGATMLQKDIDTYYAHPNAELPPLELSLRDAVLALQDLAASPAGERARRYWLDRLPHLPGPPELAQTSLNKRVRSRLQRREGTLDPAQWERLKRHAAAFGLTPTGAVAAAYAEVLSAWSGSQHFILSNMTTRRLPFHPDMMAILGNFASLYPLEVDLRGDLDFAAKALRLQQQMMRDGAHREWGGMQVMQALNRLAGSLGSVPCPFVIGSGLFMEKYQKADFGCLETAQTVLDHQFWEIQDGRYFYVWDLLEEFFPAGLINEMWQAFGALLARLAADPGQWQLKRFSLAPAAELGFLPGRAEISAPVDDGLLHDGLARVARLRPQAVAVRASSGAVDYASLDRWADVVASNLTMLGVRREELVAIVMDRGPAIVAAAVGTLRAGAAYVPVDPALPMDRLAFMLENAQARVVLTSPCHRDRIAWPKGLTVQVVDEFVDRAGAAPADAVDLPSTRLGDLAYVIYTSGSTGRPKGVMIEHRAARNTVVDINRRFDVTPDDIVLGVSSFSFDLSVYDIFGVLDAGACVVYPDPAAALNPAHWLELLQRERVTVWNSAPSLMSLLVETAQRQQRTLPALRLVMLSGDWIPVELPDLIRLVAPQARVISLGGATEASIWSIAYDIGAVDPSWTRIPYGKPLANQAWHVRDAQNRPVPAWTVGDLYISGTGLARGYWDDAEKTRAAFIDDPETGRRLYRTGDRGRYLPDGNIEFLGRADTQVKIQGHRIELGEIEAVLSASPLVKDAVVLVRPAGGAAAGAVSAGGHAGPGDREIVACVVPADELQAMAAAGDGLLAQLRVTLQQKLPAYMLPAGWALLQTMPLSANGKTDRAALARMSFLGSTNEPACEVCVPPRTATECGLADIWRSVLKVEEVSVRSDFFASGGQSIDAVRYVARIKERFNKLLSLADIWTHRHIEAQALLLDAFDESGARGNLFMLANHGSGQPLFMVHPAGGQCVGYQELAGHLTQPVWGLTAHAEEADNGALADLTDIARRYVDAVVQRQSRGPYALVGWSSGGCIAHAMVADLESRGRQVSSLTLIDCPAPVVHEPIPEARLLECFIEDLNLGVPFSDLVDDQDPAVAFDEQARFLQVMTRLNERCGGALELEQMQRFYRVFKAVVGAVRRHRPVRVAADLLVLRANQGRVTEFADHPFEADADWGWRRLTTGGVRCNRIDGTHHTVLTRPGVERIAHYLQSVHAPGMAATERQAVPLA